MKVENSAAVGGMRNPQRSITMVGDHRAVGIRIAFVIESFLDSHSFLEGRIHSAIGAVKGSVAPLGPTSAEVVACRKMVALELGADLSDDPGLTELSVPLLEAWASAAQDIDKPLMTWLREGTPAGITQEIESVGIFPPSEEPPSRQFELAPFDELHTNYQSMEDSPHGHEVLMDLIKNKYVMNVTSEAQAK